MLFPGFARFGGGAVTQSSGPAETALPTYFGSGTSGSAITQGVMTPGLPTGWEPGHYHICQVFTKRDVTASMDSGWIKLLEQTPGGALDYFGRLTVFGRVAQTGDTGPSVTMGPGAPSGGSDGQCAVHGFAGVYVADPIDDSDSIADTGVALSYPSLDCTGPNRMIVGFTAIDSCSGYTNANLANITERWDLIVSEGGMCMWTGEAASAGAIGATTANGPNTDGIALGILALRPA